MATPALVQKHLCLSLSVYSMCDLMRIPIFRCHLCRYRQAICVPFSSNKHLQLAGRQLSDAPTRDKYYKMNKCLDSLACILEVQEEGCWSGGDLADIRPVCVSLYWTSRSPCSVLLRNR